MINLTKTLLVFLCLVQLSVYGQELKKADLTSEWNLFSEKDGIKIFLRSETCDVQGAAKPFDYTFIKVENTNSEEKIVDLQLGMNYNGNCIGCSVNDIEAKRKITVPANSFLLGDCTFERGELSYLIENKNYPNAFAFKSVKLIYLNIQ